MILRILLLAVLSCTALPALAGTTRDTQEHSLANGLKIVVREDHRAPVAICQLWYKVGGSHEHNGQTGISHALEHMMFRGTTRFPAGEFARKISEFGGQQNAFTGHDYTAYYEFIDNTQLNVCLELEADRMKGLTLNPKEFSNELNVVLEERRLRVEDNPDALAEEYFHAISYLNNPRQHPVIGWMNDILALTVADLRNWYTRWYAPNNATLVVVGDVKPSDVFSMAEKYFGAIPAGTIPPTRRREDPNFLGKRVTNLNLAAESPHLFMGYNTTVILDDQASFEPYALMLLSMILDEGKSSRFTENLIRNQAIAASIETWFNPFTLYDSQLIFSATPSEGYSLEVLEQAFLKEVDRLKQERVTEEELQRVKTIAKANHIYEQDSIVHQANEIGSLESVGLSWRVGEEIIDKLQSITPEQIQQVARKYLITDRLSVAYVTPKKMDEKS